MRIAVTGGSGRVGRAVVAYLCEQGHSVVNIDRKGAPDSPARFVYMDLRRREILQPVLEQVEAVVHLGEIPHAKVLPDDETFAHNTAVASTVLQTAADLKLKHVVYTSTCQVYGAWGHPAVPLVKVPMDEDHPLQPQNTYALSKVANESYCRHIARSAGLRVSIFRLPWVISAGGEERVMQWLDQGRDVGNRDGFGTYIHAIDAARAYEAALRRNLEGCQTYHVMASDAMTRRPVRQLLAEGGMEHLALPADWPEDKPPVILERAQRDLGWEPRWSLWAEHAKRPQPQPEQA